MHRLAIAFALATTTPALASDSITIEASDGFRFLRCIDGPDAAACEYLAAGDGTLRCVAFDANDQPLAAQMAFATGSRVYFEGVAADAIDTVICE